MTVPPADDEETPGLASERTDLAWNRSGLALAVAAAAILKVVLDIGDYRAPAVITALLLVGAAAWALSLAHGRYVAGATLAGRRHSDGRKLRSVALVTTWFAVAALVIAMIPSR
jgi:uncharacterized membrane protein YidH (DUF202 family)